MGLNRSGHIVSCTSGHFDKPSCRIRLAPARVQWRLYWANSKNGITDLPQIAEFRKEWTRRVFRPGHDQWQAHLHSIGLDGLDHEYAPLCTVLLGRRGQDLRSELDRGPDPGRRRIR